MPFIETNSFTYYNQILSGPGPWQYAYTDGRLFDRTTVSDDANGNRFTIPGTAVAFNTVSGKLIPYDHNNGSPTYECVGFIWVVKDIRFGDVAINPVMGGHLLKEFCVAANTGGSALSGATLVTALAARAASDPKLGLPLVIWD